MSKKEFRSRLKSGWVLGDGAMATLLHQSGQPIRSCFEELNVSQPDLIQNVHATYLSAGAEVIQTNTYSGSRVALERYGLQDQVGDINRAAVRIARVAVQDHKANTQKTAYVFGTIGSTIDFYQGEDRGESHKTIQSQVEEQVTTLIDEGVEGIVLETYPELEELELAVEVVRRLTDLPIIANLSPIVVGVTRDGHKIEEAFSRLQEKGADVVGLNCRLGLTGILKTYEQTPLDQSGFYSAVPNSGLLHMEDGAYSYTANADYFADIGVELVRRGVRFVGGCCGTTPEHIKALREQLDALDPSTILSVDNPVHSETEVGSPGSIHLKDRVEPDSDNGEGGGAESVLHSLIERVKLQKTIVVELDPPRVLNIEKYLKGAEALQEAGVDAITLADNSLGTVRVSNMALASLLKEKGIEPLVHIACRDRNLIGQQSHLMGLHVLGIHNILLITGDPSKFGDLPGATSVYDVNSTELIRMVKRLNQGLAFSGQDLKQQAKFVVGTSFNPNVPNFNKAIDRLKRKLDAGADYVMTQPIYDVTLFEQLARAVEPFDIPVFVGIMPITSSRNAQFLHHEVPGIRLTDDILERMKKAPEAKAHEEGLRITEELLDEACAHFNGIYLITPFLRYELTVHLTKYIRQNLQVPAPTI